MAFLHQGKLVSLNLKITKWYYYGSKKIKEILNNTRLALMSKGHRYGNCMNNCFVVISVQKDIHIFPPVLTFFLL